MLVASMDEVEFGYNDVPCIQDASVEIQSGEFVAITGPNGAAKSTLLKLLLGLLDPWKGSIFLSSTNKEGKKLRVGYVSQQISAFNSGFPSTILEFVQSGRYASRSWFRKLDKEDEVQTEKALRQVGMWDLRKRKIGELSGGQKQRICIARALAQEPDMLVLDEPTTGMDQDSRFGFYELMHHQVKAHGRTVVMVTHGLNEVAPYLDRIIELERKEDGGWKCCTTTSCSGHFVPVG
ncbi:metal ABC transporter ATP-binding protein [Paenibacillus alginolyticus]|uniref:Metal ABC transporter ATP-binding protein n=1 Tax=Paenibacillus alginolyticus TaxID=59839 RepID=A0ABT4G6M0_9BACL|nr:metal ABC transporter ATP-binding protein [Paenibacillus alginolyticus]MCY9668896.1 metal ABC transporter ATP-binding protein [Paenibacillus alginolyticus]MCY9691810.1 metal ABC transporter ATP-binding protein [Paenibacillus alginolyticus]MEC0143226.1 metal ABC transporter ATP-binding protein [Paenibacillus alginolyticus]